MDELERARRLRDKLAPLRGRGPETFGAETHGWAFAPPLDEDAVQALEAKRGVTLPPAFRAFLLEIAASGAGPYYGLLPPESWGEELTIADMGCGSLVQLVVDGDERGRVKYVPDSGGAPFFPDNRDFLDWYERWIDELSWGFDHNWFGMQMPGDEATFASIAGDGTAPRRTAALKALWQVPKLGEAARAAVLARLFDDEVGVRTAALALAGSRGLLDGQDEVVRRLLRDRDASVRLAALRAVTGGKGAWHDAARVALDDADEEIVGNALYKLSQAKQLQGDEVVRLLGDPRPGVRRAAVQAARMVDAVDGLLDGLLSLARAEGDEDTPHALLAITGHVRQGRGTPAQLEATFALTQERLARPIGRGGRTVEVYGLAGLVRTIPGAFAALIELTRHADAFIRWEAVGSLENVAVPGSEDGEAALAALRALQDDPTLPKAALPGSGTRSTGETVGARARRAIAAITAKAAPDAR